MKTIGSATAEGPRDAPCYQIRVMFHEVCELKRFQTAKVNFIEKSFVFEKIVAITNHARFPIHV